MLRGKVGASQVTVRVVSSEATEQSWTENVPPVAVASDETVVTVVVTMQPPTVRGDFFYVEITGQPNVELDIRKLYVERAATENPY